VSAELQQVRKRIDTLTDELEQQGRKRSRAERELAETEKSEQDARRQLTEVRAELGQSRDRQAELQQQSVRQRQHLEEQRSMLAQQVRMAYVQGNEEWLRVALNQEDVTALGRRMTYYSYLSRQRGETIRDVTAALAELEATRTELEAELQHLIALEARAAEKVEEIARMRATRSTLVSQISADIRNKDAEISRLQAQANELTELVEALARVVPAMPETGAEPFAGKTASLNWPVKGAVQRRFGAPRAGGTLKWQGVLLKAPAGADVRSVYHGRVVFSDWLNGMGLLVIVDHGSGYMSLYAHNQDLLKDVGDWVNPDEVIAHVGDSGGQNAAGLYFEIRKDGKPVDPQRWVR